jgi:PPOX class probable F420-dependent enzyme
MSEEEVRAFLTSLPARPGVLATTRSDGRPHLAPIWYTVEATGEIVFNTDESSVKGRNLRRSGRAALCVQDDRAPFSFVTVEGPVTISDSLEEVRRTATVIGGRYMGEDRAEEFGRRNGVDGELAIWLHPDRVISAADVSA